MTTQQQIDEAAERCNRARSNGVWDTTLVPEYRSGYETWLRDCSILADAYLDSRQWQNEPDEDGWYWLEGTGIPYLFQRDNGWFYRGEFHERLSPGNRRVCKIVRPMEPKQ